MRLFSPYETQRLTQASYQLTAGRRIRRGLLLALGVAAATGLLAVKTGYLNGQLAAPFRLVGIQTEHASLAAEMERTRTELDMERATRAELQRQSEALSARVTELTQQLEFVTTRRGRTGE